MRRAQLIVLERQGTWAVALRAQLRGLAIRIRETRSAAELWGELQQRPGSFVALELRPESVAAVIGLLVRINRRFPATCSAVLAPRKLASHESLIREAGAIHVAFSPRQLAFVKVLAQRHFDQLRHDELSVRERIVARLPWGA